MPVNIVAQADAIAEAVREHIRYLSQRNPPTLAELGEIAQLYQLLMAHVVYVEGTNHGRPG